MLEIPVAYIFSNWHGMDTKATYTQAGERVIMMGGAATEGWYEINVPGKKYTVPGTSTLWAEFESRAAMLRAAAANNITVNF